jgi:hypothetical protein
VLGRSDEENRRTKCFRCQEMGHHQKGCVNILICYKCKGEGHMAVKCAQFHSKASDLKMIGFGIPE